MQSILFSPLWPMAILDPRQFCLEGALDFALCLCHSCSVWVCESCSGLSAHLWLLGGGALLKALLSQAPLRSAAISSSCQHW